MAYTEVPDIICEGSPFAIGLAHGKAAKDRIRQSVVVYTKLYGETAQIDWQAARKRASAFGPAVKDLTPQLYEEMLGIAEGSGLGIEDIICLNVRSEIALTNYSDGCSSLAKSADNDGVFVGQNWDWVEEAGDSTVLLDIRGINKPRIRMLSEAGVVGKIGMNDAGVGVCMNAIKCGTIDRAKMPVHVAMRMALESRSWGDAKEMLERLGVASCVNIMVADRTGRVGTFECTPRGINSIVPEGDEQIVWHTNHLCETGLFPGIVDHPASNSFSRFNRLRELSVGQPISVDNIRRWLSDEQGAPVSICRSKPPGATGVERMVTLATIITNVSRLEMHVSFGKPSLDPPVQTITF